MKKIAKFLSLVLILLLLSSTSLFAWSFGKNASNGKVLLSFESVKEIQSSRKFID